MSRFTMAIQRSILRKVPLVFGVLGITATMFPVDSQALPLFARQTGQNCVACHAGGQFPELTPYGRAFKLTGFTMGDRVAVPLSVMGLVTSSSVRDTSKSDSPSTDFAKNGTPLLSGGSIFTGGKITDNIGAFIQWTYDNFATGADGGNAGHAGTDNVDIRYADRFIDANRDLIFGVSLNNNPSVTDVWNTAAAWMQYVPVPSPTSSLFIDGTTPFPSFDAVASPLAGVDVYMYWNKLVYVDVGTYRTANGVFSVMSKGVDSASTVNLDGANNPYWRLALTHEWGPHNIMVGTSGMISHVYDLGSDTTDPNNLGRFRNAGVDAQYQYILDPHTITAQVAYMHQVQDYSVNSIAAAGSPYFLADGITPVAPVNNSDTTNTFRAKLSYIFQAKYGGSLAFFNKTGTTNTLNQSSGYDTNGQITSTDPFGTGITSTRVNGNLSGNPASRGMTYEAFFMPVQNARIGVQYTAYNKFNGATDNYDGLGRNASDNNSLFFYVWGAY